MKLRIEEKDFFQRTRRNRTRQTATTAEQTDCERKVEQIFRDFLMTKKILAPK